MKLWFCPRHCKLPKIRFKQAQEWPFYSFLILFWVISSCFYLRLYIHCYILLTLCLWAVSSPLTGRCFFFPSHCPTHPPTHTLLSLSLCCEGSGWRGGKQADSGASGWQTELMCRAKSRQSGRLSIHSPLPPTSPLPLRTVPEHHHPSGWWPIALHPHKNSPSHYSSASLGAARSLASLPGLRIWLCRHRLATTPLLPLVPLTPLL